MALQIIRGLQSKRPRNLKALPLHYSNAYSSYSSHGDACFVINLPHSRILKLVARFVVLGLIFASLFMFGNILDVSSPFSVTVPAVTENERAGPGSIYDLGILPLLFCDLITKEGLLRPGGRAVFMTHGNGNDNTIRDRIINQKYDMGFISISDLDQQRTVPDGSLDLVITYSFHATREFIDRTLKAGGIVVLKLGDNTSFLFNKPSNYKVVYFRRFQSPFIALKKAGHATANISVQRKLLNHRTEARKAALNKLEDVLLEPPRAASRRSSRYLKKTRFLPDLMGDTLDSYPRRVFIDVGLPEKDGGSGIGWFAKNYPTRNLDFEMYKIETVTEESSGKEVPQVEEIGISSWLRKNVKEEEYVVMKAEAEVVEEMMESKAIRLVDELFMECKPRGHGGKRFGSRRVYWECLALYGRLRDEGVAVHQWWG